MLRESSHLNVGLNELHRVHARYNGGEFSRTRTSRPAKPSLQPINSLIINKKRGDAAATAPRRNACERFLSRALRITPRKRENGETRVRKR